MVMLMNIKKDIKKIPITEFEKQKKISFDISLDSSVTIFPSNELLDINFDNENGFLPQSKEIFITLRENGLDTSLYDDGKEKMEIRFHSAPIDISLPLMLIKEVVLPIYFSILGAWIYEKYVNAKDEVNLELSYATSKDDKIEIQTLKGSAEEIHKFLELQNQNNSDKIKLKNHPVPESSYWDYRMKESKKLYSEAMILKDNAIGAFIFMIKARRSFLGKQWEN